MFHLHFVPGFQTKKAEFFWFRLSLYHFQQIGWCLSVWQCMCANIFIVWDDILPIRELCRLSECFFLGVSNIGRKGILKSHRKDIIILLLFVDFDYLIHSFNFSFICLIIYIIFHLIFFLFVNFSPFNIFMFAIFYFPVSFSVAFFLVALSSKHWDQLIGEEKRKLQSKSSILLVCNISSSELSVAKLTYGRRFSELTFFLLNRSLSLLFQNTLQEF